MAGADAPVRDGDSASAAPVPGRPTVAVVVPSYNHAAYVEGTLRSIFAQTYPPSRLLVIDDGSRDDSARVIARVLEEAPFPAELVVRPNRGLCATLNEGLARTTSDLFAYLGSDDLWHPDRLRLGVQALRDEPGAVAAYSDCYVIDDDGRITGNSGEWGAYRGGWIFQAMMQLQSIPMSPTMLYSRAAIEAVRWNEQRRLEDYETNLGVAALGPIAYVPQALGYWRQHGSNTSDNLDMMLAEAIEAQRSVAQRAGVSAADVERYRRALEFRYASYFLARGKRARALALGMRNLRYAASREEVARFLVRLATPSRLLRLREASLARRAFRRYGATE